MVKRAPFLKSKTVGPKDDITLTPGPRYVGQEREGRHNDGLRQDTVAGPSSARTDGSPRLDGGSGRGAPTNAGRPKAQTREARPRGVPRAGNRGAHGKSQGHGLQAKGRYDRRGRHPTAGYPATGRKWRDGSPPLDSRRGPRPQQDTGPRGQVAGRQFIVG
ncbi:unnamed protein product [Calypogeia fissa]